MSSKLLTSSNHSLIVSCLKKSQLLPKVFHLNQTSPIYTSSRILAGHSHWQNVRHIKEAKDKEKSNNSSKFGRLIQQAIKTGGSRNPNSNSSLASAIQQALAAKVPKNTIERLLNNDTYIDPYLIEAKGSGGIFFLFESSNKQIKKERHTLVSHLKKFNCTLNDSNVGGITRDFFSHKGFIVIESNNDNLNSLDSATELGIEVGAEDVELIEIDENKYYQLQVAPNEIDPITLELEKMGVIIFHSEDRYIPLNKVQVPPETAESLDEMYSRIRNGMDTIDRIFDNVEVVDS